MNGSGRAEAEPFLILEGLRKRFGEHEVLRGVELEVPRGEIFALLGPSGSGKTTALRILAGFETPTAGAIRVAGDEVTGLDPARRRFGMVFQHYALFPHLTVGENVAFGLPGGKLEKKGSGSNRDRVAEVLALVDLPGFEDRPVTAISGGQQQRVALARALAPEPRVLLLDEPLSNLDPALRERTRRGLAEVVRRIGITTVLVTHEQEEAFDLGDRVGVLHDGRLAQVGTPEELYERPTNPFVARFVGRAAALTGRLAGEDGTGEALRVRLDLPAAGGTPTVWPGDWAGDWAGGEASGEGSPVELILRPESLELGPPDAEGALPGRVVDRRYAGPLTYYTVRLAGTAAGAGSEESPEVEVLAGPRAAREGDAVGVRPAASGLPGRIFPRNETEG